MTSIFSNGFSENQIRVHSSRQKAIGNVDQTLPNAQKQFAAVLADVEKKPDKSAENKGVARISPASEESSQFISNLKVNEHSNHTYHLPPLIRDAHSVLRAGTQVGGRVELTVKILDAPVTKVAPEVTLKKAPDQPEILSARPVIETRRRKRFDVSHDAIEKMIQSAGKRHGIDPELGMAIAKAESSLRPNAVSRDGHSTKGLFQLLDSTGKEIHGQLNVTAGYDPFNPAQNAYLGVGYLRRLHDVFSKETALTSQLQTFPAKTADDLEKLAIAAFNAGEGNVARAQRQALRLGKNPSKFEDVEPHLPSSTRAYVNRVGNLRFAAKATSRLNDLA